MNLLPYYRSQFIANCIKHEPEWAESLLDDSMSHWYRNRVRFHEFFRVMNRDGQVYFEYSVTLPVEYFRTERQELPYPRAVPSGMTFFRNEQYVLMAYKLTAEKMNGSVIRFLFKARSETAQMIDFSNGSVRKRRCAGLGSC